VDWEAVQKALKEVPRFRKNFIIKHTMGMCGVGKFMKIWKKRETDKCPRCGKPEDSSHVWICDQLGALDIWNTAVLDLDQWMVSAQTDPDIRETIIHNLSNWYTGHQPHNPLNGKTLLAFDQQSDIGWNVSIEGWISFEWAAKQEEYYKFLGSRRTGRRWVIALIKKLWQIAWDLWQHCNSMLYEQENDVLQKESEQLNRRIRALFF
jgi:hypothetical protein